MAFSEILRSIGSIGTIVIILFGAAKLKKHLKKISSKK